MQTKKFLLATLGSAVVMWIVAGLWHNLIMPSLYEDTHASHDGIGTMFVAYVALGGLMALLYRRWVRDGHPLISGLIFGALVGILWVFPHELTMAGAHGEPLAYVFKNAAWHAVEQGLGGIVVGLSFGRGVVGA